MTTRSNIHYVCMIQGETQQTRIITLINLSRRAADAIITNITCSAKLDLNTFGELRGLVNKCCAAPFFIKYPIRSGCNRACLTRWLSQSNKGRILSKTHANLF